MVSPVRARTGAAKFAASRGQYPLQKLSSAAFAALLLCASQAVAP